MNARITALPLLLLLASMAALTVYLTQARAQDQPLPAVLANPSPPKDNEAHAIVIARRFSKAIGKPEIGPATAEYIDPYHSMIPARYCEPFWRVRFAEGDYDPHATIMRVVDGTGVVCTYSSVETTLQDTGGDSYGVHRTNLPGAKLEQLARKYSSMSGIAVQGSPAANSLWSRPDTQFPGRKIWLLRWRRSVKNIPYTTDETALMLDAQTGALLGLAHTFMEQPPVDVEYSITSAQADAIQAAFLKLRGVKNFPKPVRSFTVAALAPGWCGDSDCAEMPDSGRHTAVAYTYAYEHRPQSMQVTIDAQTGAICAGGYGIAYGPPHRNGSFLAPSEPLPIIGKQYVPSTCQTPLPQQAHNAKRIEIDGWRTRNGYPQPLLLLSPDSRADLFGAFGRAEVSADVKAGRPPAADEEVTYRVVFVDPSGVKVETVYYPTSGRLATGYQLADSDRAALDKALASVPPQPTESARADHATGAKHAGRPGV